MPLTMEDLVNAGFPKENFPEELPAPSPDTISMSPMEGQKELYRYEATTDSGRFAMEIIVDRGTIEDPAEGVNFMLNQFGYLWRTDKGKIAVADDGTCWRIEF